MNHINVIVKPNTLCPPCWVFEPEISDFSFRASDDECDRSDYIIDCKHSVVCKLRAKVVG